MLEAVKLDDIDVSAVKEAYSKAKASFDGAESGSMAKAEAQVALEATKAMAGAIGAAL